MRAYSRNRFPRLSSVPFTPAALAPAAENVWQGGPPIIKSIFLISIEDQVEMAIGLIV